jgi:hypothetical protein
MIIFQFTLKNELKVTHACILSYPIGRDQEDQGSRLAQEKVNRASFNK